jgi:pilus assembly protein CpaB
VKRLTPAFLTILMLGVVGLLVLGYVAKRMFAQEEAPPEERINVPMALADLPPGTLITEAHLGLGPARREDMTRETVRNSTALVGRIVKNPIAAAQPISTLDLYLPNEFPPMDIAEGMQALTISLGSASDTVDGLVRPNEYVDVHFSPASVPDNRYPNGLTMTLFKGVKVLAINRSMTGATGVGRGSNSVTLELSNAQANILIEAQTKGAITLTYNPSGYGGGGVDLSNEDRATLDEILGLEPPTPPTPPQLTEIYTGSGRRVMAFRDGKPLDLVDNPDADWSYNQGYGRGRNTLWDHSGWGGGAGYYGTSTPGDADPPAFNVPGSAASGFAPQGGQGGQPQGQQFGNQPGAGQPAENSN